MSCTQHSPKCASVLDLAVIAVRRGWLSSVRRTGDQLVELRTGKVPFLQSPFLLP